MVLPRETEGLDESARRATQRRTASHSKPSADSVENTSRKSKKVLGQKCQCPSLATPRRH